jgi:DNA-binding transcriptional MerR regulator
MTKEFVTATRLGHMADISADAVRHLIRTGRLVPTARTESGSALFTREQAERWAKEHRLSKSTPPEAA